MANMPRQAMYPRQNFLPEPSLSPNAFEDRFYALTDPRVAAAYAEAAARAGLEYNPNKHRLTPLVLSEALDISQDPDLNDRNIVLSAAVPTQEIDFFFSDPCFINRISATVLAPQLTLDGQPEQNFFNAAVNPSDYVYCRFFRQGSQQVYMQRSLPLSEFAGNGINTYLFDLIPVMERGERLGVELTIIPPGKGNTTVTTPVFCESIGFLDISLHCHRWDPFGT